MHEADQYQKKATREVNQKKKREYSGLKYQSVLYRTEADRRQEPREEQRM